MLFTALATPPDARVPSQGFHRVASAAQMAATASEPTHEALRVLGKTGAVRNWLRLSGNGEAALLQLDKHGIASRCAVPLRDLRVLEPGLTTSYAPAPQPRAARLGSAAPWPAAPCSALTSLRAMPQFLHHAAVSRAHYGD